MQNCGTLQTLLLRNSYEGKAGDASLSTNKLVPLTRRALQVPSPSTLLIPKSFMKTSQVFTRAKKRLSTGPDDHVKTEYICYAIDRTRCPKVDREKAKNIIMELLDNNYTFGSWLENVKGIENDRTGAKLQETRHAWLDHLITHYSNIGD